MGAPLLIHRDKSGASLYDIDITTVDAKKTFRPTANTDLTVTVPTGSTLALITGTDHYYVGNAEVTLPTEGAAAIDCNGALNLTQLSVENITTLHFKVRVACDIEVIFTKFNS